MDFDKFFRLAPDLLCVANLEGRFIQVNAAWQRTLQWTEEELMAVPFFEFVHKEDLPRTYEAFKDLQKGKVVAGFQNRYRCRDGTYRWVEWGAMFDPVERVIYATARDLTEQLKARDRISTLTENVPAALYEFVSRPTGEFYFTYLSKGYERMFGRPDPSLFTDARRKIGEDIHEEDRLKFFEAFQRSMQSMQIFQWEGRIRDAEGDYRMIQALSHPRRSELNEIVWAGFMWDVTDQRRLEEELAIERARVEASSKMALLGEMAGGVAHEINNPLATIMGRATQLELLLNEGVLEKGPIERIAREILGTSERISHIVRSLRSYSRNVAQDPFRVSSLRSVMTESLPLCRPEVHEVPIQLSVSPDPIPADWMIDCRPVEITQILLNLVQNAIDAISESPQKNLGEILIQLEPTEVPRGYAISVVDNGPGVRKDVRERLMQPFVTTKAPERGTGLGLSIARRLAEAHGGSLEFVAGQPRTTFCLWLPASKTKAPLPQQR